MSLSFTKLFSSILESTIWCQSHPTRIVWITMLAMRDRKHIVWASIPGLANRAQVTIEEARAAVENFLSPDSDSRTRDYEGRRIEAVDGGWRILNGEKYRKLLSEESARESKRDWAEKNRKSNKVDGSRTEVERVDTGRGRGRGNKPLSPSLLEEPNYSSSQDSEMSGFKLFWGTWPDSPRRVGRSVCEKIWRKAGLEPIALDIVAHVKAMTGSKQWKGGFEPKPGTYLNERRWEDGPPTDPTPPAPDRMKLVI